MKRAQWIYLVAPRERPRVELEAGERSPTFEAWHRICTFSEGFMNPSLESGSTSGSSDSGSSDSGSSDSGSSESIALDAN
jgi:hypothetical protein